MQSHPYTGHKMHHFYESLLNWISIDYFLDDYIINGKYFWGTDKIGDNIRGFFPHFFIERFHAGDAV